MASEHARWRDFALALTATANRIALEHFGPSVPAALKPDGSPVTVADRAIEAALRDQITRVWPEHALLGEEEGGVLDPAGPTWVIDPIDGTKNFLRGVPVFATLIAVVEAGHPVVGVVSAPAMGECWDAVAGEGTRRNGEPVQVSSVNRLADAHVLHGGLDKFRATPAAWELLGRVVDAAWRTRGFGDFWMHLLVAGARADAAFERDLSPWDIAAPACIVTEAGGRVTTWDGGQVLAGSGDTLSTNAHCHDAMLELLRDSPKTR